MGRASSSEQTIRPHPIARIGLPSAYATIVAASWVGDSPEGPGQLAVVVVFVAATVATVVTAIKERVLVEGSTVRVIRSFTSDEVARSTIHRVAQAGGRGRPTALVTGAGDIRLPALMTARRLATALDVPLTTHRNGPVGEHPFADFVGAARGADGRIRPIAWVYGIGLLVMFALFVAMIAAPT
jgi:hypothetical protein